MKALITITQQTINHQSIQTVSARELHRFMEVGRDFSTWITGRIEDFGYEEGRDFIVITLSPDSGNQNGRGGDRRSIEYHLTLDMAKELAMVERNPMGRVARKYFIKCEQTALELIPALQNEVLTRNLFWGNLARYHAMGLNQKEIGRLVGRSRETIRTNFRRMERCGLVAPAKKSPRSSDKQLQLFPMGALR